MGGQPSGKQININDLFEKDNDALRAIGSEQGVAQKIVTSNPVVMTIENIIANVGYLRSIGFIKETDEMLNILSEIVAKVE